MDDLKKKKQDRKLISLTQKHELSYLKKIAIEQKGVLNVVYWRDAVSKQKMQRIIMALIRFIEKERRKR